MLWKLTAVLAFSLAWLPASAVRAEGDTPECCNYNGFYLGVGGGYAIEHFDGGDADNGSYVNARAGYRFLDFLAIEAIGEFMPHFNGNTGNYLSADTSIWSGWGNVKVYPVARWSGWFQPYISSGIGYMWGDTRGGVLANNLNDNGPSGRFGAGVDLFLTEHIYFTVDGAYLRPWGGAGNLDQTIVGGALQYRF